MKSKLIRMSMALALCVSLLAACGSQTNPSVSNPAAGSAAASSSASASTEAASGYVYEPIASKTYSWGTSGTSGTHYVVAAGIADVVNEKADSANFLVQSTAGATENLALMLSGELDFGYMTSNSTYNGYYKTDYMADRVPDAYLYNVVMTTHGSTGHMLARVNSGISSYADLKGKNVCTGTTAVETYAICESIIATYGIDVEKDMTVYHLSQDEAITKLQDGELDAVYLTAGYPIAAFNNLVVASPGEYTLVQADVPNLEEVIEKYPYLSLNEVPAGTYQGIDFSVNTLRTAASVNTPVDTPAAVTYELAKYTYENWAEIQGVHAALKETDADGLAYSVIPLHPGAEAFFESVGAVK